MLGLQSEHFFSFFMEALIIFFITLFGMAFGSFFNVCIYRLPRKMSIAFPNSHCPNCNTPIKPYHNIPIFSYLFLRGKCHYCGAKIHWHYFLVEVITPLLFVSVSSIRTFASFHQVSDFCCSRASDLFYRCLSKNHS